MVDPEISDFLIRAGQSQTIFHHRMREECRVEIKTDTMFLSEFYPPLEVSRFQFVTIYKTILFEDSVVSMNIEFFQTRHQAECFFQILEHLIRIRSFTRIITCCLDTTGQRTVIVKTGNIIDLPAVNGNRNFL